MKLVIAMTGASGVVYGVRLLCRLNRDGIEVYFTLSDSAARVLALEEGLCLDLASFDIRRFLGEDCPYIRYYHFNDLSAPMSSGSARFDAMAIVPCSMGTLGRIANGVSDDLITRAADVCLKEKRKLILVTRETPLNLIHLRNMSALAESGAIIMPACPHFYHRPQTKEDLVDSVVARVLDHLGIECDILKRWGDCHP